MRLTFMKWREINHRHTQKPIELLLENCLQQFELCVPI